MEAFLCKILPLSQIKILNLAFVLFKKNTYFYLINGHNLVTIVRFSALIMSRNKDGSLNLIHLEKESDTLNLSVI